MKNFKILLIFLVSVSLLHTSVRADEDVLWPNKKKASSGKSSKDDRIRFILGVEGGINLNMFSQNVNWTNYYANFGLLPPSAYESHSSGFGISPHFGILGDIPFSRLFSLQIRADLDFRDYGNKGNGFDYIHNFSGGLDAKYFDYEWKINSIYAGLAVLGRFNIVENLFLTGGFDFQFLASTMNYTQTFNITDPDQSITLNNFPYWNYISGNRLAGRTGSVKSEYTSANKALVGLEFGVGYKIPITRRIWIVPQARYQYFLNPVAGNENWTEDVTGQIVRTAQDRKLMALQFVLALWFGF